MLPLLPLCQQRTASVKVFISQTLPHTVQGNVFKHSLSRESKALALPSVSGRENFLQISTLLWRKLLKTPETSTTSQRLKMRFRDIVCMLPKLHSLYLFPMIVKEIYFLRKV